MPLDTLLVVYPLQPPSLVDDLRKVFKTVHNWPILAGNDYSGRVVPLPPPEVLADADVILCFHLPSNLKDWSQTPKLKLLQLVGAGAFQVTNTDFYRSIPADSPLILSNSTVQGFLLSKTCVHDRDGAQSQTDAGRSAYNILLNWRDHQAPFLKIHDVNRKEQRWMAPTELGTAGFGGQFIQEIRGQTFGVIGYGHLGREVGRLAQAFGARLIACTREGAPKVIGGYILSGTGDKGGTNPEAYYKTGNKASLHEFLGRCDVVINALPASHETNKFLGREEFTAMRNSAIVVNIGRGETMDHDSLVEALQAPGERDDSTGKLMLRGASLDVTDPEPLPTGHILFSLSNVILTPHVSWASKVNFLRAVELLGINKTRIDAGEGALNALRGVGEKIH
ncbi:hypothetical protein P7C70_g4366, partial [Phenoliferia sp. Uapishka_3]